MIFLITKYKILTKYNKPAYISDNFRILLKNKTKQNKTKQKPTTTTSLDKSCSKPKYQQAVYFIPLFQLQCPISQNMSV